VNQAQTQKVANAAETVTLTMSVVAVAATPETATVTAIVTAEDAVETAMTAKKPNQRFLQMMF
jgi:hypothetical protein